MGGLNLSNPPKNGEPLLPATLGRDILMACSGSKRQRRPSVRLGEVGSQPASAAYNPSYRRRKPAKIVRSSFASAISKHSRKPRSNWPSVLEKGFEATVCVDLKSSSAENARYNVVLEDSGSLSERNDHRDLVRAGVSGVVEEVSDEECKWWFGGVRSWLDGLGLGLYAPVFELHDVDEEVLPLLTLEDLRDMGINSVGLRRKMYCAIQKLSKGRNL
ncbi:hypothetical protein HPP92_001707 [Vanilla planifolia]|uniref:SAM domain-containing protein n=1 Tax=Vanilla planifolia TaxID=51239 RepID=A0A835RZU1_VANPL|nr:hypothetical protein HPP92_001707 [Vanilla planifolia]